MSEAGDRLKAAINRDAELRETLRANAQRMDAETFASLGPPPGSHSPAPSVAANNYEKESGQ